MRKKVLSLIVACSLIITSIPASGYAAATTENGHKGTIVEEPANGGEKSRVENQVLPDKTEEKGYVSISNDKEIKNDMSTQENGANKGTNLKANKDKNTKKTTVKKPAPAKKPAPSKKPAPAKKPAPSKKPVKSILINTKNFDDKTFREYVKSFDENKDGKLSEKERNSVKYMNLDGEPVTNLHGIGWFKGLEVLNIAECKNLKSYTATNNPNLRELMCWESTNITSLKIDQNSKIEKLDMSYTGVKKIALDKNINLNDLNCAGCNITSLNLAKNTKLEILDCSDNQIGTLSLRNNNKLKDLNCWNNPKLKKLDVTACTGLITLDVSECVSLENLDVRNCMALKKLECWSAHKLENLNLSNNKALVHLDCSYNELENLDVSKNLQLEELICEKCALTALDVSANKKLTTIKAGGNQLVTSLPVVVRSNLSNNFNPSKVSNVQGGVMEEATIDGKNKFTNFKFINSDTITYDYEIKKGVKEKFSIRTTYNVATVKPAAVTSLAIYPDFGMIKAVAPKNKQEGATYRFSCRESGTKEWHYYNSKSNEIIIKDLKKNVLYDIAVANVLGNEHSPYKQKRIYTNRLGNDKEPMEVSKIVKLTSTKGKITATSNKIRYKTDPKIVKYRFAYRVNGTKTWTYINSTKYTKTIEKLKSGKTYNVAVCHYYISPLDKKTEVKSKFSYYKNIKVK